MSTSTSSKRGCHTSVRFVCYNSTQVIHIDLGVGYQVWYYEARCVRLARATFAHLRELRDRLADRLGRALPELSMGMSGDAEAAVAEGATMVRIGTAIFGPRPG